MATKTVCVTGASGFIASWLVKFLLHRGYTVNATVRDLNDAKKTQHLVSLEGAKERLKLFAANLSEEGSFDAAIAGCEGVFHTASPFFFETSDPQKDLLDPAVKGTLNVLKSVTKIPSVKRVILTSSEAAIAFNPIPKTADTVVDETMWSDPDYCRENQMWYLLSKTLAEKAAWDFAKEKGIDLVSINPPAVSGITLPPIINASCSLILSLLNCPESYANMAFGWVDVKDVAEAHILAYEKPEANGRYYVVEKCYHLAEIANTLRELCPSLKIPQKCADNGPLAAAYKASNERAKQLGVVFTPIKQSIKETIDSFKEKGFFKGEF